MIELNCTNCNKVLSIDDAFAGGVCRCQHCGTIQTVPAKGNARTASPVAAAAGDPTPKSLYKRKARIESALSPFNDRLDEAADQIPSSGLSNSSLVSGVHQRSGDIPLSSQMPLSGMSQPGAEPAIGTSTHPHPPSERALHYAGERHQETPAKKKSRKATLMIAGGVIAVVAGAGAWLLLGSGGEPQKSDGAGKTPVVKVSDDAPHVEGVPLEGNRVVYILDRSGCSNQVFKEMVRICGRSVATLGSGRQFKVLVMGADKMVAFPSGGMKTGTPANLESMQDSFAREFYVGQKNAAAVFRKAIEGESSTIVLFSANDDHSTLYETVAPIFGDKPRPVKVFYVGSTGSPGLKQFADLTGGEHWPLSLSAIK